MSTVAMSGADSVIINNRILSDFADGDFAMLEFPNDIANVKTGKNGNSIYSLNTTGKQSEVTLRIIRASADDKYLNGLINQQQLNFAGKILDTGEFVKQVGDGAGNVANDTYLMSGGIFTKSVGAKANAEGDTEQSVSIYKIKFSNSPRVIT